MIGPKWTIFGPDSCARDGDAGLDTVYPACRTVSLRGVRGDDARLGEKSLNEGKDGDPARYIEFRGVEAAEDVALLITLRLGLEKIEDIGRARPLVVLFLPC